MPWPSRSWRWLVAKEWRELLASWSFWILLSAMGPLVGVAFIGSVRTYAEASGWNGTAAGVGEAFAPLVGVWAPTFSACELAAAFLLPFVAIRLVAADRQSGALKLELQSGMPTIARVCAKALVLLAGWLCALVAPLAAILLWKIYGGTLFAPELLALAVGHVLNAGLTIGIAAAAAALTEHPSTAAILALGVTVGGWILVFVAAIHGGVWERAAGYTPSAMVTEFQHGLVRLDAVLIVLALTAFGLCFAALWMRLGVSVSRRTREALVLTLVAAGIVVAASFVRPSWDLSENRANSFSRSDEAALAKIDRPLLIEAHLAPEDPRRFDLERRALKKLRRALPHLEVRYVSATSIGLFEQTSPHYGEILYEFSGRHAANRLTTAEGVLETIYELAHVAPPPEDEGFRGHPLAAPPVGAAWVFYVLWPVVVVGSALLAHRRQT